MSFAFLFHYLMLNMFRMLIYPSSGACDLFVELFHGLYCSGSMCVGVVSECRLHRPWTHYLPTGLDNLPAAAAHTNTRL